MSSSYQHCLVFLDGLLEILVARRFVQELSPKRGESSHGWEGKLTHWRTRVGKGFGRTFHATIYSAVKPRKSSAEISGRGLKPTITCSRYNIAGQQPAPYGGTQRRDTRYRSGQPPRGAGLRRKSSETWEQGTNYSVLDCYSRMRVMHINSSTVSCSQPAPFRLRFSSDKTSCGAANPRISLKKW